ncbi:MAG: hypothetical protein ACRC6A_09360 [Fusobacteriaceae bacterium]
MLDFNRLDEVKWVLDSEARVCFGIYTYYREAASGSYRMYTTDLDLKISETDWKVFKVKVANYFLSEVN